MNLKDVMILISSRYRSDREAAEAHDMTKGQWSILKNGQAFPTERTLKRLGIRVEFYLESDNELRPMRPVPRSLLVSQDH
jgi:hypothetical protein